jgi:hypothetical protein
MNCEEEDLVDASHPFDVTSELAEHRAGWVVTKRLALALAKEKRRLSAPNAVGVPPNCAPLEGREDNQKNDCPKPP